MKTARVFTVVVLIAASGFALRIRSRLPSSAPNCSGMI
jgi:hypothetical protein